MIADMATELRAARLLTEDAARKRAERGRYSLEASMAKLFASEIAGRVADRALQIHGGYGYSGSLPLERYVRDLRIMRIYEGSSEIQRTIIARTLTGRDAGKAHSSSRHGIVHSSPRAVVTYSGQRY